MTDEYTVICALLHDVAEDTDTTVEDISAMGFPGEVCDALRLLTHDPSVPYMDYVAAIKSNPIARAVKIADLTHNSDVTRLDEIDERMQERLKKYKAALAFLLD